MSFVALEGETSLSQHALRANKLSYPSQQDVNPAMINKHSFVWRINIGSGRYCLMRGNAFGEGRLSRGLNLVERRGSGTYRQSWTMSLLPCACTSSTGRRCHHRLTNFRGKKARRYLRVSAPTVCLTLPTVGTGALFKCGCNPLGEM